jgi:hypothetical protein
MKRYRILGMDFDSRATELALEIEEHWEEQVKETHRVAKKQITEGLLLQFGTWNGDIKIKNFTDLGPKPFSVIAFHNKFSLTT